VTEPSVAKSLTCDKAWEGDANPVFALSKANSWVFMLFIQLLAMCIKLSRVRRSF